jgi:hypothetical protein
MGIEIRQPTTEVGTVKDLLFVIKRKKSFCSFFRNKEWQKGGILRKGKRILLTLH